MVCAYAFSATCCVRCGLYDVVAAMRSLQPGGFHVLFDVHVDVFADCSAQRGLMARGGAGAGHSERGATCRAHGAAANRWRRRQRRQPRHQRARGCGRGLGGGALPGASAWARDGRSRWPKASRGSAAGGSAADGAAGLCGAAGHPAPQGVAIHVHIGSKVWACMCMVGGGRLTQRGRTEANLPTCAAVQVAGLPSCVPAQQVIVGLQNYGPPTPIFAVPAGVFRGALHHVCRRAHTCAALPRRSVQLDGQAGGREAA
eukprot:352205-Chlamydomonas_euryale.AAC.13